MRIRQLVLPIVTDLMAALGFASWWGLRWLGCAPPSPLCQLPGNGCVAACSNPWAQWPMTFSLGLLLGVAPAAMAFVVASFRWTPTGSPTPTANLPLALSGASILLMAMGLDLIFLAPMAFAGDLVPWACIAVAAPLFALSVFASRIATASGSR